MLAAFPAGVGLRGFTGDGGGVDRGVATEASTAGLGCDEGTVDGDVTVGGSGAFEGSNVGAEPSDSGAEEDSEM